MFPVLARSLARRTIQQQCIAHRPPPPPKFYYPSRGISNNRQTTTTAKEDPLPTSTSEVVVEPPTLDVDSSKTPTIDFAPQKEFQRTGARSSKGSLSSSEQRRRFMGRVTMAFLAIGIGAHVVYMGREWTDDELKFMKTVSLKFSLNYVFFSYFLDA